MPSPLPLCPGVLPYSAFQCLVSWRLENIFAACQGRGVDVFIDPRSRPRKGTWRVPKEATIWMQPAHGCPMHHHAIAPGPAAVGSCLRTGVDGVLGHTLDSHLLLHPTLCRATRTLIWSLRVGMVRASLQGWSLGLVGFLSRLEGWGAGGMSHRRTGPCFRAQIPASSGRGLKPETGCVLTSPHISSTLLTFAEGTACCVHQHLCTKAEMLRTKMVV